MADWLKSQPFGGGIIAETKKKRWKKQSEYDKKTFKRYELMANVNTDSDIIEVVERRKANGEKTSDILKSLIRK